MDVHKILQLARSRQLTLLGVGPMSRNCVEAAIELANEHKTPLMLIASRRQIDSADFGGGYVNRWTTEAFCQYVKERDHGNYVGLARDHSGPWQNDLEVEKQLSLPQAMASAKKSLLSDITAGMQIIHLDPNRNLSQQAPATMPEFIERTKELLLFCHEAAISHHRSVIFEIGTDEGQVGIASFAEIQEMVETLLAFCQTEKITKPKFIVLQTGTKVMEMRNTGILDLALAQDGYIPNDRELKCLIEFCRGHDLLIKEHNADYLSDQALAWHANFGINSANVAPEFGVAETKALLHLLLENGLSHAHDQIVELAFMSGKWEKWMLENSTATDYDKAVIAGHYVFADPRFLDIKQAVQAELSFDIDHYLCQAIKKSIHRYLYHFNLISEISPAETVVF